MRERLPTAESMKPIWCRCISVAVPIISVSWPWCWIWLHWNSANAFLHPLMEFWESSWSPEPYRPSTGEAVWLDFALKLRYLTYSDAGVVCGHCLHTCHTSVKHNVPCQLQGVVAIGLLVFIIHWLVSLHASAKSSWSEGSNNSSFLPAGSLRYSWSCKYWRSLRTAERASSTPLCMILLTTCSSIYISILMYWRLQQKHNAFQEFPLISWQHQVGQKLDAGMALSDEWNNKKVYSIDASSFIHLHSSLVGSA